MEMLANSSLIMASGGLWATLIGLFADWIINYGWTIILFTVCLKIILSPLDILQRTSSQKQTQFMAAMQPEMDKLQKKYGDDKEKLNQEQAALYKRNNFNIGGMCFTMLITMVITMVVFFTLYASLRDIGNSKLYSTYERLDDVYVSEGMDAVKDEYQLVKTETSWLWVKNVWKADTNASQFVDKDAYVLYKAKKETGYSEMSETDQNNIKDEIASRYDIIVSELQAEEGSSNGYYVLIILAAVISFLTQFLSAKLLQPKGQKLTGVNKVMFVVLPLSMVLFAWTSNVVFTLYIITNSVMSALISTIISLIMNKKNKGKTPEQVLMSNKKIEVVEYSRNYKK